MERISCERTNIELTAEISLKPSDFTILFLRSFQKYPLLHASSNRETLLSLEIFASSFHSTSLLVQFRLQSILSIFDFIYREDERVDTIFPPSLLKREKFHGIGLPSLSFVQINTNSNLEKKEKRKNRT